MSYDFYIKNCYELSKVLTKKYSTSFSLSAQMLEKEKREAIYAIYGFVRIADEIVDSFHNHDKLHLLNSFINELNYALENGISTNPIIVAFANTVNKYNIEKKHIDAFVDSMKSDIYKKEYTNSSDLDTYIYGSADVVGLMCLKVFCNGNNQLYLQLENRAQNLGTAFQKVNFLRDIQNDTDNLQRNYFPELANKSFNLDSKRHIEVSIESNFREAYIGILKLPGRSRLAVLLAYNYYYTLFLKIKRATPETVLSKRIRISNFRKYIIIFSTTARYVLKFM